MVDKVIIPKRISIIGWTPVEEALPEEEGIYLIMCSDGEWDKGLWTGNYWSTEINPWQNDDITHWAEVTPPEVE
jgi:hypothetical protein